MSGDIPPKPKSRKKSKGTSDAMLESTSKIANRATSSSMGEDTGEQANPLPIAQRGTRRVAEEILATDIPTIPMNEVDSDDAIDMAPKVAVAPEFSVHQMASFKEIEREFARERASQYLDPKVDISILYHNIHLQEEIGEEDHKPWNWDKIFVEIRNAVTIPIIES